MAEGGYTREELKQIEVEACYEYLNSLPNDCTDCYFKRIDDPTDPTRYFKCKITNYNVYAGPCRPHCTTHTFTKHLLEII